MTDLIGNPVHEIAKAAWEASTREHARRIAEAYEKGGKNALEAGAG